MYQIPKSWCSWKSLQIKKRGIRIHFFFGGGGLVQLLVGGCSSLGFQCCLPFDPFVGQGLDVQRHLYPLYQIVQ